MIAAPATSPVNPNAPSPTNPRESVGGRDYVASAAAYWRDRAGDGAPNRSGAVTAWRAHQILSTCGPGRLVDVGCGRGELVRELLNRGVDAQGVDVSPEAIGAGAACVPGRFREGSALALPHADGEVQTATCVECLEYLSEADVDQAILELARVASRSVFIAVATTADAGGHRRLVRGREWWEQRILAAGGGVLRKHPATSFILPYEMLEHDGSEDVATLVFERVPRAAAAEYPLASLREGRGLHMDMLREAGRRSDAHVARYALAAGFVRRHDRVLDAACGLGYGAAVIGALSTARSVIGLDSDPAAVAYARANFVGDGAHREFVEGDCHDLSRFGEGTFDMVVSFETLEHLREPGAFLAHAARMLRPGGRLVASVPNDWTDHTGRDPNPHHLHVYTWEKFSEQVRGHGFEIERAYAQTAGAGMKHPDQPRRLSAVGVGPDGRLEDSDRGVAAEWWLIVAMKPATGEASKRVPFVSRWSDDGSGGDSAVNAVAFGRDYQNPWLADAMVTIGHRLTERRALNAVAARALAESDPASADAGAALCVLAYGLIEGEGACQAEEAESMLEKLAAYDDATAGSHVPHVRRWRVSNRFAAARLLLMVGKRSEARTMFERCAELDPLEFSPLLATKTVEACFLAGQIAVADDELGDARRLWLRGLSEARRALGADWRQAWGSPERPMPFAMPELAAVLDNAAMCAGGLIGLDAWRERPGAVWRSMRAGTKADLRAWIAHLERRSVEGGGASWSRPAAGAHETREWLQTQLANWRGIAESRGKDITELRRWCDQLVAAKRWLESKVAEAAAEATRRAEDYEQGRSWLKGQVDNWRAESEKRDAVITELKRWTEQLEQGKAWLAGELEAARTRAADAERKATDAEHRASDAAAEVGRRAVESGAQINQLKLALMNAQDEVHRLKNIIAERDARILSMQTAGGVVRTAAKVVVRLGRKPGEAAASSTSERRDRGQDGMAK